jgi:hypothetical protein
LFMRKMPVSKACKIAISDAQRAQPGATLHASRHHCDKPGMPGLVRESGGWRCIGKVIVDGEQRQLQAADNPDLIEDIREMMFHRVFT